MKIEENRIIELQEGKFSFTVDKIGASLKVGSGVQYTHIRFGSVNEFKKWASFVSKVDNYLEEKGEYEE